MSEQPEQPMAAARGLTPPTDDDVLQGVSLGDPVGWPKVIGIVSIVWASLGLLGGACGVVFLAASPMLMKNVPGYDPNNVPPTALMGPLKILLFVLGFVAAGVLLFAGIATVGRRESGRLAHLAWAGLNLLIVLPLQLWVQYGDLTAMEAWIAANPKSPFSNGGTAGLYVGIGVALVLGLAWPLFTLVWFGLIKKKPGAMQELKPGY